jgi:hypothetical protein
MLLLIRKIKRLLFTNKQFHNYLLYALGEMVLVILGILIALQINNWNNEKQQREKLRNYLEIIAKNIAGDLESIHEIRMERERAFEASVRLIQLSDMDDNLSIPEVTFASQVHTLVSALHHFNANTSGYEALKSSGTLNQVAGSDIESLLYEYYDTVNRIVLHERDYNENVRLRVSQMLAEWPEDLDSWEFANPKALTVDRFESLEPAYMKLLNGASADALVWAPQYIAPIMRDYSKLDHLGRAFQQMVEDDVMDFDDGIKSILSGIHDPRNGKGDPILITAGQPSIKSCAVMIAHANDPRISYEAFKTNRKSPFDYNSIERIGDRLQINYKGDVEWAGIWFPAGMLDAHVPMDYSGFDKLVLELKGNVGGETIHVNIEDRDDPPNGTSTKIALQLTDRWETYEIPLADFETADLEILTMPLGFVLYEEPVSFSIRSAKYIKPD